MGGPGSALKFLVWTQDIDLKDKWVRIIIAAIILIIIFIIFFTPTNEIAKVNALSNTTPTEIGKDVEVLYSDSAHIKAKLNTPEMIRTISDENPTMEMPKGLKVKFFDNNLNENSRLTAKYGIRYLKKYETIVRGNVVVVNAAGETINTEELIWKEDKDSVKSDKQITIHKKDETIIARGFVSDLTFTHYRFYHLVGEFFLEDKPKSNK